MGTQVSQSLLKIFDARLMMTEFIKVFDHETPINGNHSVISIPNILNITNLHSFRNKSSGINDNGICVCVCMYVCVWQLLLADAVGAA